MNGFIDAIMEAQRRYKAGEMIPDAYRQAVQAQLKARITGPMSMQEVALVLPVLKDMADEELLPRAAYEEIKRYLLAKGPGGETGDGPPVRGSGPRGFWVETWAALTRPAAYYARLDLRGSMAQSWRRAWVYCFITMLGCLVAWFVAMDAMSGGMVSGVGDLGLGGMLAESGGSLGILLALFAVFAVVMATLWSLGLFVGVVFLWLASLLCGGTASYRASVRVGGMLLCSTPLAAVALVFLGVHPWAFLAVAVVIQLYSLRLLYNAFLHGLGGKVLRVRILCIMLGVLAIGSNVFNIMQMRNMDSGLVLEERMDGQQEPGPEEAPDAPPRPPDQPPSGGDELRVPVTPPGGRDGAG